MIDLDTITGQQQQLFMRAYYIGVNAGFDTQFVRWEDRPYETAIYNQFWLLGVDYGAYRRYRHEMEAAIMDLAFKQVKEKMQSDELMMAMCELIGWKLSTFKTEVAVTQEAASP